MSNTYPAKPDHQLEDGQVVKWQLLIFSVAFILGNFVGPFLPHTPGEMVFKFVDMLFICGTILLAIKLAREGWDLAAAGFTILGIGWGILFAALDFERLEIDMEVRTSAAYFFIPCMSLIACYRPFPRWLKLSTLACMIPFVVSLLLQKAEQRQESAIILWINGGFGFFHLVSMFWAFHFYKQYKRHLKRMAIEIAEEPQT